jgi:hypothetical protein
VQRDECAAVAGPRLGDEAAGARLLQVFADLIPGVVVRTHGPLSGEALADLLAHVPPPQPARGTEPTFSATRCPRG